MPCRLPPGILLQEDPKGQAITSHHFVDAEHLVTILSSLVVVVVGEGRGEGAGAREREGEVREADREEGREGSGWVGGDRRYVSVIDT